MNYPAAAYLLTATWFIQPLEEVSAMASFNARAGHVYQLKAELDPEADPEKGALAGWSVVLRDTTDGSSPLVIFTAP